ncbi:MAG TPA: beta-ketoacyl-[acyl-carrier-protein] synthase family protein [Polyangiaceae bacterium]|nr:beta-ketoacyl-[acyl-carrier-protein] synthase family protein [Polyangiaceae bacterium]
MNRGRIAVTGVGMITALGRSAEETFAALVRGDRGFSEVSLFDVSGQRTTLAAEVRGFAPRAEAPRGFTAPWSRSDALALVAARDALARAGVGSGEGLGVTVGVTTGGMLEAEALLAARKVEDLRAAAEPLLSYPLSSTADRLVEALSATGPSRTICSACSSSANALVQAASWLVTGRTERVLAGGTDALCRLTFTGFNSLGATDKVPCRPFDRDRQGLTLGEGAAFLVLETEEAAARRGATVVAFLSGWAVSAEAHHITQPEPSGRAAAGTIAGALRRAGLDATAVDYVNAHGTGTTSNDTVETLAIHAALGAEARRVFVSSSKGQLGHTLGAAGAIEAAVTVLALSQGVVPPTGGLVTPDEACRLRHVTGSGEPSPLRAALSSSFGFGGTGTVLAFERGDARRRPTPERARRTVVVTAASTFGPSSVLSGEACAPGSTAQPARLSWAPLADLDPERSRRFDSLATFATLGARAALESGGLGEGGRSGVGLVVGTAFGNVERTAAFLQTGAEKGPKRVPPAEFPHLLPSAASGNASIYLGLRGPILSTCDLEATGEAAVDVACDWLESGEAEALVAGSGDPYDSFAADLLGPACETVSDIPRSEGAAWVLLESDEHARARGADTRVRLAQRRVAARTSLDSLRLEPPSGPGRALVLAVREPVLAADLLRRSGWGSAEIRVLGPETGFHEGVTAYALAFARALVVRGQATDVLVVGWNARRLYAFHFAGPG